VASRRQGRVLAFQALYSWEAAKTKSLAERPEFLEHILEFAWLESPPDEVTKAFALLLVMGTVENIGVIDRMIRKHSENWDFSRINRIDLAILRMSAYTLLFQKDIPFTVVISEAVAIAKDFGEDNSYRFINGVLDGIHKTLENRENRENEG
jgi:N utilization substance protein B